MLGDELRKTRLAAGLTQEQLAFKAQISRNYISLLELNKKSPTIETLQRICRALGITMSGLIGRWEKRNGPPRPVRKYRGASKPKS